MIKLNIFRSIRPPSGDNRKLNTKLERIYSVELSIMKTDEDGRIDQNMLSFSNLKLFFNRETPRKTFNFN